MQYQWREYIHVVIKCCKKQKVDSKEITSKTGSRFIKSPRTDISPWYGN